MVPESPAQAADAVAAQIRNRTWLTRELGV